VSKAKQQQDAEKQDKEKLSRVSRSQQKQSRQKRRMVLVVILLVVVVLGIGAALNVPYINIARRGVEWASDKISGSSNQHRNSPKYIFFTVPQSGKALSGTVSTLLGIYKGGGKDRIIVGMAVLSYDANLGQGEVYILSEGATAYNAAGQKIELSQALQNDGGLDLLRATVANISGLNIDYVALLGFNGAVQMLQAMQAPGLTIGEDTAVVNPVNGDVSHLFAGQEVGDCDRILSYLLAYDNDDRRRERLERATEYLPEALHVIGSETLSQIEDNVSLAGGELSFNPANKTSQEDQEYLASMIQAFANLSPASLSIKAVPRVEVLNGGGIPELGKKIGDKLTSLGVLVGGTGGNAKVTVDGQEFNDFSHDKSSIIYRKDDPRIKAYAQYLGVLLAIEDVHFDSNPGPDLVVIVGKDKA
jgi:LytR cell envelope-related transcriptional attenuator